MIKNIAPNTSFLGKSYVIGHKNPDTDSITSAIAYSYLKEELKTDTNDSFVPLAAGNINPETEYVLNYFGIQKPQVQTDLSLKVSDVLKERPLNEISIQQQDSLRELYNLMYENNLDTMPVLDDEMKVIGLITPKDILKFNLNKEDTLKRLKNMNISFDKIKTLLDADIKCGNKFLNDPIQGNVNMGVYSCDETRKIDLKDAMVLVGDREDIQEEVINQGAKALVITKGKQPSKRIIDLANEKNMIIFTTSHGTSSSTKLIEQSVPVQNIMNKNFISIDEDENIDDIQNKVRNSKQQIFPVTSNEKFIGIITLDEIIKPNEKEFILVDHNSSEQFAQGIKRENIKEIVDHHRQEFLPLQGRIPTTYGDVGASATLIAKSFKANSIKIPKEIAGMLWCAIMSDTDALTSPTTTHEDVKVANEMFNISYPLIKNKDSLIDEMFEQRNMAINSLTDDELVDYDRKTFKTAKGKSYSINQIFTSNNSKYIQKQDALKSALNMLEKRNYLDGATMMITNIREQSTMLVLSKKLQQKANELLKNMPLEFCETKIKNTNYIYENIIKQIAQEGVVELEKVSSRKEQVEPLIRKMYEN